MKQGQVRGGQGGGKKRGFLEEKESPRKSSETPKGIAETEKGNFSHPNPAFKTPEKFSDDNICVSEIHISVSDIEKTPISSMHSVLFTALNPYLSQFTPGSPFTSLPAGEALSLVADPSLVDGPHLYRTESHSGRRHDSA
jgi:hypothetical protein